MKRRLLIAALFTLIGSGIACSKSDSPTTPTPTDPANGAIFYTAIGASDGIGFGSSSPCIPFTDCPDGAGYVQILRRRLSEGGRTVEHRNLSIPGAVLSRAIEDLAREIGQPISELAGNFVERQAPFVPTNTTHVTIFAGGNDANVIGRAALAGRGGSDPSAYIDAQVRQWGTDLEDLVARIRSRAPSARIVALNMINLAGAPYVSSRPQSEKSIMQRIAVGISDRVNALTSRNVLVVDLMCDARLYQPSNYASDGFHPGDGGYAVFAEDTLPALRDGANNQPNTGCAQRRLFP
ncbi:MAG: SGNH/GDSL hydrolase family protein [Cyanobacteria bacterium]|nr:SGNH/GDSL hydrolase family protein [Cyanobacteriota bacterium]